MNNFMNVEKNDFKIKSLICVIFMLLAIISPVILYIVSLLSYFYNNKYNKLFLSWFIIAHALLAYNWIPWNQSFDLTRFHEQVYAIEYMDNSEILKNIVSLFAPFSFIITYIVYLIGNVDLLQFIVTLCTMSLIIYQINFYADKYGLKGLNKFLFFSIIYFTVPVLRVISGLWSMLSIAYISFLFFLKRESYMKSELLFIVLLYSATFIHFGSIIPFFLYVFFRLFKLFDVKKTLYSLSFILVCMLLTPFVSKVLYDFTNIETFSLIGSRFNAYVFNQESFAYLNNIRFIIVEISKPVLVLLFLYLNKSENEKIDYSESFYFSLYLSVFTLSFGVIIRILLRFTLLALLISIPFIASYFSKENLKIKDTIFVKIHKLYIFSYLFLNISYQYYALYNARMF